MDSTLLKGNELSTGYDRLMLDLLFDLVAGNTVDSKFRYEDQLDYYRSRLFGDSLLIDDLCDYADKFKKATKIMFPCSPAQIRSKSFLVRLFASYVMIHNLYRAASFDEITDESEFLKQCIDNPELSEETFVIFEKEIRYLYGQYTTSLIRLKRHIKQLPIVFLDTLQISRRILLRYYVRKIESLRINVLCLSFRWTLLQK